MSTISYLVFCCLDDRWCLSVSLVISSVKFVMLFAQCHALSSALLSLVVIVAFANGQDYRYQMYGGGNNYPPAQTAYDRNLPQSANPYDSQLNQYGLQFNYQNRPLNNQPNRPGTPSYRPNGYNYPVSSYLSLFYHLWSLLTIHWLLISEWWYFITSWNTWSMANRYSRKRTNRFKTTRQRCIYYHKIWSSTRV